MIESIDKDLVCGVPSLWKDPPGAAWYCPGCQYPVIGRILCEVLEELKVFGKTVSIVGVGCCGYMQMSMNTDMISVPHGRAIDAATGAKRTSPDLLVWTLQGDGDCISIGAGAIIGALNRAENITVIVANNANFGTTGGQMAPTTLLGQVTKTSPYGRDSSKEGYPVKFAEVVAMFEGAAYSARGSLVTPADYRKTKGYIMTAFEMQLEKKGLSYVEVLSACPTNWHLTPVKSLEFIKKEMIPQYPLGEFKKVD